MPRKIKNLQDVVDWGLCFGCGACAYVCEPGSVRLVNVESDGIRPVLTANGSACAEALEVCPGYTQDATLATGDVTNASDADREIGATLEIWEGYSVDPEIRHRGSSGGLLTALSLYCLEQENMAFVLHAGMDEARPWLNATVTSRTRAELLSRTGSRYAPASPCEKLAEIEHSDRPCVFIGKPTDTMATWKARKLRPGLDRNLGLVLTFFCAGEPSTQGTLELLKSFAVEPAAVDSVHYRGEGWPGEFRVQYDGKTKRASSSYRDSWARLTKFRVFRWQLDPDGLGCVADISCGDAWESFDDKGDEGRSLVLVRTERGQEILKRAIDAGYVNLWRVNSGNVLAAQGNLLQRRKDMFGRLLAMKLLWIPTPRYRGFSLFSSWLRIPFMRKVRTVLGTMRRLVQRGLWRRQPIDVRTISTKDADPAYANVVAATATGNPSRASTEGSRY
ncbi:MAG: Coenzyme F420 hydrogenase/dehydrogenase, beta subunit C-terminal domain [Terriglobales bacterium]